MAGDGKARAVGAPGAGLFLSCSARWWSPASFFRSETWWSTCCSRKPTRESVLEGSFGVRAGGVDSVVLGSFRLFGPELASQISRSLRTVSASTAALVRHAPARNRRPRRDVLSRTLHAARFTLLTAVAGCCSPIFLGSAAGCLAGLLGGIVDRLVMRSTELFMALPALYLILALRNLFPDSIDPIEAGLIVVVSLAVVGWSGVARLVRGQVLSIREEAYIVAARAAGASRFRLVLVHVLGILRPFLLLQLGLHLPYFLLGEVTLSFLGLGLLGPLPPSETCWRAPSR